MRRPKSFRKSRTIAQGLAVAVDQLPFDGVPIPAILLAKAEACARGADRGPDLGQRWTSSPVRSNNIDESGLLTAAGQPGSSASVLRGE